MRAMLASYAKAIAQLADPRMAKILLWGILATLALYVAFYAAVYWAAQHFLYRVDIFGWHPLTLLSEIVGGVATFILSLLLFPAVATTMLSFLLEAVCRAVEDAHYPGRPPARKQGFGELLWQAARFALVMLIVNLIGLAIYVPLAILFGLGALLFYVVNGYLLAREYFELVAMRRLDPKRADALRRAHLGRLWITGIVLAVVSTVPFLNLLAPIVGTATMVHEFEALREGEGLL